MLDTIPLDSHTASLALVAAIVAATAVYGQRRRLGPHADWIETVRATTLPVLDPLIERYAGGVGSACELTEHEYVGHVPANPEDVERQLWDAGCRRNVVSAFKTLPDDREQVGMWVYRGDDVDEHRQVDVMLFKAPDDGTDIYAHEEYLSRLSLLVLSPDVLRRHYQGVDYDPEAGEQWVRQALDTAAR